tara:strand:- start:2091 stop:5489 length:3399 start_codon:yes stop_codon:yes gene_type:complete
LRSSHLSHSAFYEYFHEFQDCAVAVVGGAASAKPQVEFVHAISYVNKIKTRFASDERVYKAFLEILNMYRKNLKSISQVYEEVARLFRSHTDLLEEFTYFLPDLNTAPGKRSVSSKGMRGKGSQLTCQTLGVTKRRGKHDKTAAFEDSHLEPKAIERKSAASLAKELAFFEKVKSRLRSREAYNELIKCLNIFNSEVISKMELQSLIWDILGPYPDLHSGFNDFLTQCESTDFDITETGKGKDGKLSSKDLQKMKVTSAREKFILRPVSELDLSSCERCGPSYRLLPKNFPDSPASARTPLMKENLNDTWVSVTSGSEDYSFKAMRKNQYEEALFRCEDDRFELDMVLETTKLTIDALEPIIQKVRDMTAEEASQFRLPEGTLTPIHLRSIERLYGIGTEQGQDIRRMILDYPAVTVHRVMTRLQQKDAEWRHVKVDVASIWVDVYEKNYNKSLDHRSFYFKQTDKKALSAKGMTNEIKDICEKKKSCGDVIGGGGIGGTSVHGTSPDLIFTYTDRKVHDDVYAVLKFSTHEMMNSEHADRVMSTWRNFFEPFFGIARTDPDGGYVDNSADQAAFFVRKDEEHSEGDQEAERYLIADGLEEPDTDAADRMQVDEKHEQTRENDVKKNEVAAAENCSDEIDDSAPGLKKRNHVDAKLCISTINQVNESELEEDDEASLSAVTEERAYSSCAPLSGAAHVDNKSPMLDAHDSISNVDNKIFYGHDGFYLLFRLHQHLYDRLRTARASAVSMSTQFGQKAEPEAMRAAKEREIHKDFLILLFKLLNGGADSSTFEDECRTLLGANSYVLFTLDKLIYKVVKQIQGLLADETAKKMLQLSEYEETRKVTFQDVIYHANASVLLLDESCYRFSSIRNGKGLTLQLMDIGIDKSDMPAGIMEAQFHDYLQCFIQDSVGHDENEILSRPWIDHVDRPSIFLRRTKLISMIFGSTSSATPVSVLNSLECKVSCSNSKVSYVLDTEDVFYRRTGSLECTDSTVKGAKERRAALSGSRVAKFHGWLAEFEQASPVSEKMRTAFKLPGVAVKESTSLEVANKALYPEKSAPAVEIGTETSFENGGKLIDSGAVDEERSEPKETNDYEEKSCREDNTIYENNSKTPSSEEARTHRKIAEQGGTE